MRVLQRLLHGVKEVLSSGDPMEEMNQFMCDRVFTEEGNLFDCVEDDRGFKDGSVE